MILVEFNIDIRKQIPEPVPEFFLPHEAPRKSSKKVDRGPKEKQKRIRDSSAENESAVEDGLISERSVSEEIVLQKDTTPKSTSHSTNQTNQSMQARKEPTLEENLEMIIKTYQLVAKQISKKKAKKQEFEDQMYTLELEAEENIKKIRKEAEDKISEIQKETIINVAKVKRSLDDLDADWDSHRNRVRKASTDLNVLFD